MHTKTVLKFSKLDEETAEIFEKMFRKKDTMIEINPGRVILPATYKTIGQDILDMEVRESDVWMCSYPRTGSTWAQEMVWLIGHDLDYEGAKSLQLVIILYYSVSCLPKAENVTNKEDTCKKLKIRSPIVELSCFMVGRHAEWHDESVKGTSVDLVKYRVPHPRYIRSHLPWDFLPFDIQREDGSLKPKVIYTCRNPKDMVVSYYHYCTLVHGLSGTFEEFCDLFMRDRAPFGPVWNHILGFWNRRNDPNLLIIRFEDMKRDLPSVIRRIAEFLGKDLTEDDVDKLCDHLSFRNIKNNRAVNMEAIIEKSMGEKFLEQTDLRFIRKGEIGDWKNYMSDDLSRRFDLWSDENMKGTGLSFE